VNYIIFDLEATCIKDKYKTFRNETIEIGAVKIIQRENGQLEIIDTFDKFIRPKLNLILSKFCKELTSIQQEDVNFAHSFPTVINEFKEWIGNEYMLCSWGFYDQKQLENDSILYGLNSFWTNKHISLKHQFPDIMQLSKPCGLNKALKLSGISFEGTHHRGIDDAKNIAKIFCKYFNYWKFG